MSKPSETVYCPICKSENISDISTYQNNGIYGKGSKQWKVNDLYCCNDCGHVFKITSKQNELRQVEK